jgi:hypothetical protein
MSVLRCARRLVGSSLCHVSGEPIEEPVFSPPSDPEGPPPAAGIRDRIGARGEEALGRIAQDLLENPLVNSALSAAFEARGRASAVQEAAMDFLNLPSAAQLERLTRRVRAVSQRLEGIEDGLARLEDSPRGAIATIATRLDTIEERLADVTRLLTEHHQAHSDASIAVSPDQERLRVEEHDAASAT